MIIYKKFQFGWVINLGFLILTVWVTIVYINQWGNSPIDTSSYIFLLALFWGIILGFCGITIIVTNEQIKIKFGIGIYTKRIDISEIESVKVVKFSALCGYGIRWIPQGTLYNVSGRSAVEIKLKKRRSIIQIGSNDANNLAEVINKSISK